MTEAVLSEAEGFRSIKLTDGDNTRLKGAYRYLGGAHGYCFLGSMGANCANSADPAYHDPLDAGCDRQEGYDL